MVIPNPKASRNVMIHRFFIISLTIIYFILSLTTIVSEVSVKEDKGLLSLSSLDL